MVEDINTPLVRRKKNGMETLENHLNLILTMYKKKEYADGVVIRLLRMVSTKQERTGIKRQSYIEQISREKSSGVKLVNKETNTGVKIDD